MKDLATRIAAITGVGAAAFAVTYLTNPTPATAEAPTTVFFAPLPLDPAAPYPLRNS